MERFSWVDNAKAIAMFLVVLGHFPLFIPVVKNGIYAFHLPAFIFLTGFLLAQSLNSFSFREFSRKYLFPYMRAYAFFSVLAIIIYVMLHHGSALPAIQGALFGVEGEERLFHHGNSPLWYFTFLIVTLIGTFIANRCPSLIGWCLAATYCAFSVTYQGPRLFWNADVAGVGVLFAYAGSQFRLHYAKWKFLVESKPALLATVILVPVFIFLALLNGKTNINRAIFGHHELLYVFNAFLGSTILFIFSNRLPVTGLAKKISAHTLVIFSTHIYLVQWLKNFPAPANQYAKLGATAGYAGITLLVCLGLSLILNPFLQRYILRR